VLLVERKVPNKYIPNVQYHCFFAKSERSTNKKLQKSKEKSKERLQKDHAKKDLLLAKIAKGIPKSKLPSTSKL
jgi:hypothetical protein